MGEKCSRNGVSKSTGGHSKCSAHCEKNLGMIIVRIIIIIEKNNEEEKKKSNQWRKSETFYTQLVEASNEYMYE